MNLALNKKKLVARTLQIGKMFKWLGYGVMAYAIAGPVLYLLALLNGETLSQHYGSMVFIRTAICAGCGMWLLRAVRRFEGDLRLSQNIDNR